MVVHGLVGQRLGLAVGEGVAVVGRRELVPLMTM